MSERTQTAKSAEQRLDEAGRWWSTSIIDIEPGRISVRGYPIQELIGALTFPQMIWLMVRGDLPSPEHARLLEATLVAAVDHGPHAPSIAISRMAITCGLPLNGAMASAINALDDIHGGAGQGCMELFRTISTSVGDRDATPDEIEAGVDAYIAAHGKIIPGFGHRWHGVDPRAQRLMKLVDAARSAGTISGRFARMGIAVESLLQRRKGSPIPMNIDGATAVIYSELGFEPALGRGLFILSRSVGILAHAWEQSQQGGRIKGPMAPSIPYRYTGPAPRTLVEPPSSET